MQSGRDGSGFSAYEVGQVRDSVGQGNAVKQVLPEGDAVFFTGFFQAGEGIATSSPILGSGAAADFAFHDVLADIVFAEVVVQRDIGPFQDQPQFGFVVRQTLERQVEGLETGFGSADFVEPC